MGLRRCACATRQMLEGDLELDEEGPDLPEHACRYCGIHRYALGLGAVFTHSATVIRFAGVGAPRCPSTGCACGPSLHIWALCGSRSRLYACTPAGGKLLGSLSRSLVCCCSIA
jgi:hypothetical protein